MSQEKYFTYYKVTGTEEQDRINFYNSNIGNKRKAVLNKMLADSGAVA